MEAEEEGGESEAEEEDEAGEDVDEGADVSSLVVARTTAGGLLLGEAKAGDDAEVEGRVEGEGEDGVEELTSAALTQEQVRQTTLCRWTKVERCGIRGSGYLQGAFAGVVCTCFGWDSWGGMCRFSLRLYRRTSHSVC